LSFILRGTSQTGNSQRQKGKVKQTCHPELRNGIGAWSFKEEEGNSQGYKKKGRCLAIRCLPCHTEGS